MQFIAFEKVLLKRYPCLMCTSALERLLWQIQLTSCMSIWVNVCLLSNSLNKMVGDLNHIGNSVSWKSDCTLHPSQDLFNS